MLLLKNVFSKKSCNFYILRHQLKSNISYIQGQEPEHQIREYFYYIDHEGMLFLDDAKMKNFTSCFKEKQFLKFFFNRLKLNDTNRYKEQFPYLSLCGRERNFVRCDDTPIVYTNIINTSTDIAKLAYNHAGDILTIDFQPDHIYMQPDTGRVYHPAWPRVGHIGLICSKLSIELSKQFVFDNGELHAPTHIQWNGAKLQLKNVWVTETQRYGIHSNEIVQ